MDIRYTCICCLLVVVSIQKTDGQCVTLRNSNCPNITLSAGNVCYTNIERTWTATIICDRNNFTSNCTKTTGYNWIPLPVNCTVTTTTTTTELPGNGTNDSFTTDAHNNITTTTTEQPGNGTNDNFTSHIPSNSLTSPGNTMTSTITFLENTTVISTVLTTTFREDHTVSDLLPKRIDDRVSVYVGVTIAVVSVAIIVIVLLIWCRKRHNETEKQNDTEYYNQAHIKQDGTHANNTGVSMSELTSDAGDYTYFEIPASNPANETDNVYNTLDIYDNIDIPDIYLYEESS